MDFDVCSWDIGDDDTFDDMNEFMLAMYRRERDIVSFLMAANDVSYGVLNADIQQAYDYEVICCSPNASVILAEGVLTRTYMENLMFKLLDISKHVRSFCFRDAVIGCVEIPF